MSDQKQKIPLDNNVDFMSLWKIVAKGKWIIVGFTSIVTLVSIIYTQTVTPTYKATTYLLPPLEKNINVINQKDPGTSSYTIEYVYSRVLSNIESLKIRNDFFNENKLISYYNDEVGDMTSHEVFEKLFSNKLTIEKPSKVDPRPYQEITFELKNKDSRLSSDVLNLFIDYVKTVTKKELLDALNFEIDKEINMINDQIKSKKDLAVQRRLDRIAQLEESFEQAKKLGIEKAQITQSDNKLNMDYNRGWLALEVELKTLKKRESDEPFIEGIRNLQERISYLKNLTINIDELIVTRIDKPAMSADEPIKPKTRLIIGFAFFFGLFFSFLIVLIREALRKSRIAT